MKKASSILISIMLVLMLSVAFVGCDLLGLFQDDDSDDDNQTVYIEINDVEELKGLANKSGNYKLVDDIDISDDEWEPIEGFSGLLEGNNKTISGLTIDSNDENLGLFATLEGTVQNMKLTEVDIVASGAMGTIGGLCGTNEGVISGVFVEGIINAPYYNNVGGLVGKATSTNISECRSDVLITAYDNVGGIVGYIVPGSAKNFSENCNEGAISGNLAVGGIVGAIVHKDQSVQNCSAMDFSVVSCENDGIISSNDDYTGGIIGLAQGNSFYGRVRSISVSECVNNNEVNGIDYTAGIVGYGLWLYEVRACNNNADILGNNYVGACVGESGTYTTVSFAENKGKISGKAYVGGIAGSTGTLISCTNNGEIVSSGVLMEDSWALSYVGGIAGWAQSLEKCTNNSVASVTAEGFCVGGIVGFLNPDSEKHSLQMCVNNSDVNGLNFVGGIAGMIEIKGQSATDGGELNFSVTSCENNGVVTGNGFYAGGIVGSAQGNSSYGRVRLITISGCVNNKDVKGMCYVGGILGQGVYVAADEPIWATNINHGSILATGSTLGGSFCGDKYGYIEEN